MYFCVRWPIHHCWMQTLRMAMLHSEMLQMTHGHGWESFPLQEKLERMSRNWRC